jgi:hypothetical protein
MSTAGARWLWLLVGLTLSLQAFSARADDQPEPAMLEAAKRVAVFIESGGAAPLAGIFAQGGVTIIENFPPYVFEGPGAVARWSEGMRAHLAGVSSLRHTFGRGFDFSRAGEDVYFSLPTTWRGLDHGKPFIENGGWAFVLTRQSGEWRVRGYGWSVTRSSQK